jgi:cell wall-associated NlpC family hydrolase
VSARSQTVRALLRSFAGETEEGFFLSRSSRQTRRIGLAGVLFALSLVAAAPAAGQTESTTTIQPGAPEGSPPPASGATASKATILPGGKASIPPGAPSAVVRAIQAANRIHRRTYIWGGGHRSFKAKGYDCSGAVSYVLHAAGLLSSPLVSGQLAFWGSPGPGAWITVFANKTHTYMYIAGLRYDTSPRGETVDQGRGPRWRYNLRTGTGFAVRHYAGL